MCLPGASFFGMPVQSATPTPDESAPDRSFAPRVEQSIAQWRQLLDNTARRHQLDRDELDEVEQDIRIRLWRLSERTGTADSASASYVYRAVVSAVTDLIRRRRSRARGRVSLDDVGEVLSADASGPPEAEMVAALGRALDTLDASRRVVVRLYLDGKDRDEIAAILAWSDSKVRNLLYRGLHDLREQLRGEEH